ncbi:hypothetical protein JL721_8168 [Aureococcus anophagefferens]|nr:hypothetical protein JL721_8168 [Aureococcus anophagefferens]
MRSPHALLAAALWFATASTEPPSSHAVLRSLALAEFRRTHPGERPAKIEAKAHAPSDAATDVLADLGREAVASALVAARGAVRRVTCACHARGPDGRPLDVSGAFDVDEANATTPVVFSASYLLPTRSEVALFANDGGGVLALTRRDGVAEAFAVGPDGAAPPPADADAAVAEGVVDVTVVTRVLDACAAAMVEASATLDGDADALDYETDGAQIWRGALDGDALSALRFARESTSRDAVVCSLWPSVWPAPRPCAYGMGELDEALADAGLSALAATLLPHRGAGDAVSLVAVYVDAPGNATQPWGYDFAADLAVEPLRGGRTRSGATTRGGGAVATGGGGAADQRRAVAARVAHFDAFWLLGDGFGDGFRAAAEARDCAAPPPAAPPAASRGVVCPSGRYGSTAMAWQAGRVANAFGERYVVGERRPHRAVAAALVPCLARGGAVEILADDPLWRDFTAEAALQRFVASPPFRAASSGETAATVAARHVAACQRWDALCVSQNVSTHAPCRGVLSGLGAPGEVACVLHAVARGRSGAFSRSTALASCAGDLLAAPKPHARPRPPQPNEALVKRLYELDAVLGNPRRLCHLGARVLSPASYWLAATRPHLEIVILAVPGESSTREELLVLERLAHLLPHRFLKAVTLNAEAALAAPSLDALRGTCDVFYADLWKLRSLNETDYAAMATFLRHRQRSRLVVPGVFDGPVPWPHQSPGGRFYLSDSRSKPPEQPTIRHFKCVDFAASDAAGDPVMALGACERSVGPNWVGFGGFRRLDVPDVAAPPRRDTRRNISTPPAADADAVFAAAGNDAGYCDYALVACAAPGRRAALAVIASAVLAAPPGPPQICKLRFHVLCNQAAAEHFAAGVPAVVTLDFYEWTRKFPAPERFVAVFKPCAVVKLFLPSLLAKNDTAGLGAAVYVDTDVLFLDDPQRVWVDAVGALAASGAVAAAAAEHGDLEAGCSSTDHFYDHEERETPRAFADDGANTGVVALNFTRARAVGYEARLVEALLDLDRSGGERALSLGDQSVFNVAAGNASLDVARLPCEFNYRTDHCAHDAFDCGRCGSAPRLLHAPRSAAHADSAHHVPAFGVFYDLQDVLRGDGAAHATAARGLRAVLADDGRVARCRGVAGPSRPRSRPKRRRRTPRRPSPRSPTRRRRTPRRPSPRSRLDD